VWCNCFGTAAPCYPCYRSASGRPSANKRLAELHACASSRNAERQGSCYAREPRQRSASSRLHLRGLRSAPPACHTLFATAGVSPRRDGPETHAWPRFSRSSRKSPSLHSSLKQGFEPVAARAFASGSASLPLPTSETPPRGPAQLASVLVPRLHDDVEREVICVHRVRQSSDQKRQAYVNDGFPDREIRSLTRIARGPSPGSRRGTYHGRSFGSPMKFSEISSRARLRNGSTI
jgi:hypothetical protein